MRQLKLAAAQNCRTTLSSATLLDPGNGMMLIHQFLVPQVQDGDSDAEIRVRSLLHRLDVDVHDPHQCRDAVDNAVTDLLTSADPLADQAPTGAFYLAGGLLLHRISQQPGWISTEGSEETTLTGSTALLHFVDCSLLSLLLSEQGELVQMVANPSLNDATDNVEGNKDVGDNDGVATLRLPNLINSGTLHRMVQSLMQ